MRSLIEALTPASNDDLPLKWQEFMKKIQAKYPGGELKKKPYRTLNSIRYLFSEDTYIPGPHWDVIGVYVDIRTIDDMEDEAGLLLSNDGLHPVKFDSKATGSKVALEVLGTIEKYSLSNG